MAPTYSREEVEYLINHCFLPPVLPHEVEKPESKPALEATLLEATINSLRRFRNRCSPQDRVGARRALQGLEDALEIHNTTTKDPNEESLKAWLASAVEQRHDVPLPLHIGSQNCGVIIRLDNGGGMMFETFELSATNSMVTGTTGRLLRAFPTSAVLVEHTDAQQQSFQATTARTLASMAGEAVSVMQAQTGKAGKNRDELRDTTNPAIVTNLFFGAFLESIGKQQEVPSLSKATRDEVLWHDTLTPWRRSPMWLLIRVFIHLTFRRAGDPGGFKRFMAAFLADVLSLAQQKSLPSALLFAMSAKISLRLIKLGSPLPAQLLSPLRDILDSSSQNLQDRWSMTQRLEECLDTASLQYLRLDEDSAAPLPKLECYIKSIHDRHSKDRNPSFARNGSLLSLSDLDWPRLPNSFPNYEAASLNVLEDCIIGSLRRCMNATVDVNTACQETYSLMRAYHTVASRVYADNPEALSAMILTLVEVWCCCDERAIAACEWLDEYDHGIPWNIFRACYFPPGCK